MNFADCPHCGSPTDEYGHVLTEAGPNCALARKDARIAELEKALRDAEEALDQIAAGDGCYALPWSDGCDTNCRTVARVALEAARKVLPCE